MTGTVDPNAQFVRLGEAMMEEPIPVLPCMPLPCITAEAYPWLCEAIGDVYDMPPSFAQYEAGLAEKFSRFVSDKPLERVAFGLLELMHIVKFCALTGRDQEFFAVLARFAAFKLDARGRRPTCQ